jgi:hypothetical protein
LPVRQISLFRANPGVNITGCIKNPLKVTVCIFSSEYSLLMATFQERLCRAANTNKREIKQRQKRDQTQTKQREYLSLVSLLSLFNVFLFMACNTDTRCAKTILDRDKQEDKDHTFESDRENAG